MSDEALRALERTARRSGAPADVMRWADELERLGRPDDALDALCLARGDAGARAAIVSRPPRAGPALLETPRERFRVKLPGSDQGRLVHAGPLGVVIGSRARVRVLDPETGQTRVTLAGARWQGVVEDVLLRVTGKPATLEAHDLWTGELLHTTRLAGQVNYTWTGPAHIVSGRMGELQVYAMSSPRRPPSRSHQIELPDHPGPIHLTRERAAVTMDFGGRLGTIVDLATGGVVREVLRAGGPSRVRSSWLGAAHDVAVALAGPERRLTAFSLTDGRERWSREWHEAGTVAISPGVVIAAARDVLTRLDAASGASMGGELRSAALDEVAEISTILPGDDEVDYLVAPGHGAVVAWRRRGGVAWRWRPIPSLMIQGAAATLGRLYLVCGRSTVVCLDRPHP